MKDQSDIAKAREQFEAWAFDREFVMDEIFMSSTGTPENPYLDPTTYFAYEVWLASRRSLEADRASSRSAEPGLGGEGEIAF